MLYYVAFNQPPGGHPRRPDVYFDADSDEAALTHMAATWTRDEVSALFEMPHGRSGGTIRPVWNASVGRV